MFMKPSEVKRLKGFIYDLLTKTPYTPENPIDQRDLYQACRDAGFDVKWTETQNQHNDHCRWLTKIVDQLACDATFDKVVSHHAYRYYVCDREEAILLLEMRKQRICLAQVRITDLERKIHRNLQGKCTTNAGTEMKPRTPQFHVTFPRNTKSLVATMPGRDRKGMSDPELWEAHCPDVAEDKRMAVYERKCPKDRLMVELTFKWMDD